MSSKPITLYYSPRILVDDNDDDDEKEMDGTKKENKKLKRFIHSIIRCEQEKFNQLLPSVDINKTGSNKKDGSGWTPILWAIQKNRISYIEQMFNTNQFIDFSKHIDHKTQRTTLHFAAERGDLKLVMLLLNKNKLQNNIGSGLDLNVQDREQSTPLFRASKIGAECIIKVLLQYGADPNIANKNGLTPLIAACIPGHLGAVQQLVGDKRTDINAEDERGRNALMCCCAEDRMDIAKLLLQQKDINLNAMDRENFNWNCLMWSVFRRNEQMLHILLDYDEFDTNNNGFCMDYFHQEFGKNLNVLELCRKRKLSKEVEEKIRSKFHSLIFPGVITSEIIIALNIPMVVISVLLVFTY